MSTHTCWYTYHYQEDTWFLYCADGIF